jgi:LacI family transcriptional regulator
MGSQPTLRTLAQAAGVSKTTVSLALRDHARIRPEVRQRIQKLAAKAGYHRNALVANLFAQLRSSKTSTYQSTLGLLCVAKDPSELETVPTFRSWIGGCRARATELGYGLDQLWLYEPGVSPSRLVEILDARNIRGLAVAGFYEGEAIPREFDSIWRRSAAVALGTRPVWPVIHFVSNDQYVTVCRAVRELFALGYSRLGLCLGSHVDDIVENKFSAGFSAAQKRLSLEQSVPVLDLQPGGRRPFASWLQRYRPEVILTIHTEVREWLTALGWSVPEDIGLVQLDKSCETKDWAGMEQNSEVIGRSAIDMVIGQLHRNESGPAAIQKSMLINSTWSPGVTLRGPAKGRARKSRLSQTR